MTAQLALFPAAPRTPSPRWLCVYAKPCANHGQAIYGPTVIKARCVNRVVKCQTCGRFGEESERRV